MIRYVVTTHAGASGAYLSKPGHWGNMPHTSIAAAEAAAARDADGAAYIVDRERAAARRKEP